MAWRGDDRLTMRTQLLLLAAALAPTLGAGCASTDAATAPVVAPATYTHDVFFRMKDPAEIDGLAAACERLREIPGVVRLVVSRRDETQSRSVNMDWFQLALHVEFADVAAYDGYGPHPMHQELLARYRANFERVEVFDALIGD